ncbi:MAG TPA: SDR family NAD(P)-dependent oxidoreductase [Steroidobacteraceae bacterium]|jgi:NAD(P)-dependent dehydrogenase (short-subunit alcohol dehydrogenase family)|nr:SDR family NAD(P)-dependent oxidoreductase [Steroidobacteraceae bacterium]
MQAIRPLAGRVAVVTGGARGMGAAIASELAGQGARVAICDLDGAAVEERARALAEAHGSTQILGLETDVTDEGAVRALMQATARRFGGAADIPVNNAGVLFGTRFAQISLAEWNIVLGVNLTGSFLCCREALPSMRERRWGRIVNMSSSAGRSVSTLGGAHYTAAKAGVLGLTRALAKEAACDGVIVNAVCPGLIDTEMARRHCTPERLEAYARSFPVARLGTAEEVAQLVALLCGPDMAYVTGASLDINGGDLMM